MALSREAYQALEDIVGPENISEDPVILDAYAFMRGAEFNTPDASVFVVRPEAVLVPMSTEEVQAIVRTCNKYRIKVKAHSTGWAAPAAPVTKGVIMLDMRGMNRILEIDTKQMFAVVEPYVIGAQLQAEAMKVGLNTHLIGAGSNCSVLAGCTSFHGGGADSIFMGNSGENMLAVEWVMPSGDILRTGSLGSRLGWFCGDGPGPSTRGLIRGVGGAHGGMGVFTKAAVKLYPWAGPPVPSAEVQGVIPTYNWPLPENFRCYTIALPTWQAYADFYCKIFDAEIGYIVHKQFNLWGEDLSGAIVRMSTDPTKTFDDIPAMIDDPEIQTFNKSIYRSIQVVLMGQSPGDVEYQEKVLNKIVEETGATNVALMATPYMQAWAAWYLIRLHLKNTNFIFGGGFHSSFSNKGTPDFAIDYVEATTALKKEHITQGGILDDGGDATMCAVTSISSGHWGGFEQFFFHDKADAAARKAARAYHKDTVKVSEERKLSPTLVAPFLEAVPEEERKRRLAKAGTPEPYIWQQRIKKVFDPNGVGDGSFVSP